MNENFNFTNIYINTDLFLKQNEMSDLTVAVKKFDKPDILLIFYKKQNICIKALLFSLLLSLSGFMILGCVKTGIASADYLLEHSYLME